MPWDRETAYRSVSEDYPWWLVLLGFCLVGFAAHIVRLTQATLPPNRGDLTVEEFVENVNQQKAYLGGYVDGSMAPTGQWEGYRDAYGFWKQTEFSYQTEGDIVTAVTVWVDGTYDLGGYPRLPQAALASGHGPGLGAGGRSLLEVQPGPAAEGAGAHGRGGLDHPVGGTGDHLRRGYAVGGRVPRRSSVWDRDHHLDAGGIDPQAPGGSAARAGNDCKTGMQGVKSPCIPVHFFRGLCAKGRISLITELPLYFANKIK